MSSIMTLTSWKRVKCIILMTLAMGNKKCKNSRRFGVGKIDESEFSE